MKNNGTSFIYQLPEPPEKLDDLNDYFVAYARDKNLDHFNAFLHWYEPVINRRTKEFIELYKIPYHFLVDLKQIYAYTVWQEMQEYEADDKIVLLQKVKYKVVEACTTLSAQCVVL